MLKSTGRYFYILSLIHIYLIRKDLGVSILPRSACLDELRKGKIAALPVENLSMVRETRIVYNKDFTHTDMLNEIIKTYGSTVMN